MEYGNKDFVPVLLGSGVGAYAIARSLHETYGIRSFALARSALSETAKSTIIDVWTPEKFHSAEEVVSALNVAAERFPDRQLLLIPTAEFYTNVVIHHKSELHERYVTTHLDSSLASKLMDKTDFYKTCAELGVPHPTTVVVTMDQTDDPQLGDDLPFEFPVILKPSNTDIYPRLSFAGKQKVYLIESAEELRTITQRIYDASYTDDLIVQEYLRGDETVMQVANTYSDVNGKMMFASVGQVALTDVNPRMVGNNNSIIATENPELVEAIRTFLEGVGYRGPANFDVMYDVKTGVSKLLEINLRNGETHYYTKAAGGNIASYFVDELVYGRPLEPYTTPGDYLWLNVPYWAVLRYAPKNLRSQVKMAKKNGSKHTLWYSADRSPRRLAVIARHQLRLVRDLLTLKKSPLIS